jgi:hypothetical protein
VTHVIPILVTQAGSLSRVISIDAISLWAAPFIMVDALTIVATVVATSELLSTLISVAARFKDRDHRFVEYQIQLALASSVLKALLHTCQEATFSAHEPALLMPPALVESWHAEILTQTDLLSAYQRTFQMPGFQRKSALAWSGPIPRNTERLRNLTAETTIVVRSMSTNTESLRSKADDTIALCAHTEQRSPHIVLAR